MNSSSLSICIQIEKIIKIKSRTTLIDISFPMRSHVLSDLISYLYAAEDFGLMAWDTKDDYDLI